MKFKIEDELKFKDFEAMVEIEKSYFKPEKIGSSDEDYQWYLKNPDIEIVIKNVNNGEIAGYSTILPLSKKQYEKYINGELKDVNISERDLLSYKNNQEYYLLFCSIAIAKKYREEKVVLYWILRGIYEKLKYLKSRDIRFVNMCAEAVTKDGQKFVESFLNLRFIKRNKDGNKLYNFKEDYDDFNQWLEIIPKYIGDYYSKYVN